MTNKNNKSIILYVVLVIALLIGMTFMLSQFQTGQTQTTTYSEVVGYFQDNKVSEFSLDLGSGQLNYKLKGETGKDGKEKVNTYKVPHVGLFVEAVEPIVLEYNKDNPDDRIEFVYKEAKDYSFLMSLIPIVLLIGAMVFFWFYMMKQTNGGGKISQFGKAQLKNTAQQAKKTTFAEVAGAEEEKEELAEIVEFLKNPKKFNELGARIPKGVLLMGPPGTGKTLLARAVAGEAAVPFFSISGSDFVEMFVGVGASRVRDLFDQAKKNAPSIIFIDEIDAVGRHRGAGLGGGHDEREQTLNQLLVEMDGFGANEGVIVIAATNRRDILDPALLRPGRFDREVVVGYPDVKGREEILKVHSRNKPLGFDVDLGVIAKSTAGFTGADLENLINEGALLAARKDQHFITMQDLKDAEIKVIAGPEKKSRVIPQHERELTAYHEAGHAVVMHALPDQDPVTQITIVPRGQAGGMTISLPEEDRSYLSRRYMEDQIVGLLGGRVAEKLCLGDISTGASNDIQRASQIARKMVATYGMSDKIGTVAFESGHDEVFIGRTMTQGRSYCEAVAAQIDQEVQRLVADAYDRCERILNDNRDKLEAVASYLLEHETMEREAFLAVFGEQPLSLKKEEV